MANEKISDMPVASLPLSGTEKVEIVQGSGPGSNKQTTVQDIANLAGSAVQSVTGSTVDNTDPVNPIVNAASQADVDAGDAFVQGYVEQLVSYVPMKQAMDIVATSALPAYTYVAGTLSQLVANANGYFPTTDGILNDATHTIDSVLVTTEGQYNGTYNLQKGSPSTPWILTRTLDSQYPDDPTDGKSLQFAEVIIKRGTIYANHKFRQTVSPIVLDTTVQIWVDVRTLSLESFGYALSDELTPLTTGLKITDRIPYAFHVLAVRMNLVTPQTTSVFVTVDVRKNGVSILSTLLSVDNNESTSVTAAYPVVISTPDFADDDKVEFYITQIGTATVAAGCKVHLIGYRI